MEVFLDILLRTFVYVVVAAVCYLLIPAGGKFYQEMLGFNPGAFVEKIEEVSSRPLRVFFRIVTLVIAPVFSALAVGMFFVIGAIKLVWWLSKTGIKALTE